ncbi:MAG: UvrB/UvrC motif-containing protein [Thermovirgaceae bacterium]
MLCERCHKREAQVHIKHMKNGAVVEYHLCHQCAQDMSQQGMLPEVPMEFPFENFLGNLFPVKLQKQAESITQGQEPKTTCPRCGLHSGEFSKTGKFGCAACYDTFRPSVRQLLRRIHGSEIHRGSRPSVRSSAQPVDDLESLKKLLREAVEKEEYERAAVLRDRIRLREEKDS